MIEIKNKILIGLLDSQRMISNKIDNIIIDSYGDGHNVVYNDGKYFVEKDSGFDIVDKLKVQRIIFILVIVILLIIVIIFKLYCKLKW